MSLTSLTDEIAGYVEAGVDWLDTEHPGWRVRVDVDALAMHTSERDIAGQTGIDIYADARRLCDVPLSPTSARLWLIRHGFDCPWFDEDGGRLSERAYFDLLTEAWQHALDT